MNIVGLEGLNLLTNDCKNCSITSIRSRLDAEDALFTVPSTNMSGIGGLSSNLSSNTDGDAKDTDVSATTLGVRNLFVKLGFDVVKELHFVSQLGNE